MIFLIIEFELISSISVKIHLVFFCYAVFGIGNGMIHLSGMVICSEYFDKVHISSVILLRYTNISIITISFTFIQFDLNFSVGHWQWAFV